MEPPRIIHLLNPLRKEIPPVKKVSQSVYGNRPDVEKMSPNERKNFLNAMRQRRFRERAVNKYSLYVILFFFCSDDRNLERKYKEKMRQRERRRRVKEEEPNKHRETLEKNKAR